MPPWQLEMARAVPTDLIADIRRDNRRSVHEPSSPLLPPTERPAAPTSGTGWVDALPLRPQDNHWIDQQIDAQDALDRTARARERGPKP